MRRVRTAAARQTTALVLVDRIERAILVVRREKVMLDSDLAALYGVATRTLIQAVTRNAARFPPDFMFQLTTGELAALRSQIVISNTSLGRGGRRYRPHVFTEQGVAMLSSVLRSERAIRVNVQIIRAFVRLRRMLASHADLARKLAELERKYDGRFAVVFEALRDLTRPRPAREVPRRQIGFRTAADDRPDRDATLQPSAVGPHAFRRVGPAPPSLACNRRELRRGLAVAAPTVNRAAEAGASPPARAGCASTRPASRTRRRR